MKISKLEKLCLLVLVAVTGLLGLYAMKRGRGPDAPAAGTAPEQNPAALHRGDGGAMEDGASDGFESGDDDAAPAEDAEFVESARQIRPPTAAGSATEAGGPAERKQARRTAASLPGSEEMIRTLDEILNQPWSPQQVQQLQDTLVKWSASAPTAALDYAMTIDSRRARSQLLNSLIGNWVKSDVSGAYAWATANLRDDAGAYESALKQIFGQAASQDPNAALRSAMEVPAGGSRTAALRAVVERAVRDGSQAQMAAYLSTLSDPQEKRIFAAALAQNWGVRDPLAAADWALAQGDPRVRSAALGGVVGSWASDQPERAAAWVAQLPAGSVRDEQMNRLAQTWAGFDPVGAADWLIGQRPPLPQLDPAIQGLVSTVQRSNPEGAMAWAGAISDARLRNRTLESVGRYWMRQNPQQAASYIAGSSLPPQVQKKLLRGR